MADKLRNLHQLPGHLTVEVEPLSEFTGIKTVNASPLTASKWARLQGKPYPADSDDCDGYVVEYEDGYVSWSPAGVFEAAYRSHSAGMGYHLALYLLNTRSHRGAVIYRKGWNGQNQHICKIAGTAIAMGIHACYGDPTGESNVDVPDAYFIFTTAQKLQPWTPSPSDQDADDWCIMYKQIGVFN